MSDDIEHAQGEGVEALYPSALTEAPASAPDLQDGSAASDTDAPDTDAAWTLPKGYEAAPELSGLFDGVIEELGLSTEAGQTLIDRVAQPMLEEWQQRQVDGWAETVGGWARSAESDPEFGGRAFRQNMSHARAALDRFGSPELSAALDEVGFGNHPELIRFFYRVGKSFADESVVLGRTGGGTPSPEAVLYPTHFPQRA